MRLLVLGGTRFLGRAVVDSTLSRGHKVTLFNRGVTSPGLFGAQVEEISGDRAQDMSQLVGRSWDAVVDVAAYHPADVARAVDAAGDNVGRYLFVSTVSVYADQSVPPVEGAAVAPLNDPEDRGPESYGARKAACEKVVRDAVVERATIDITLAVSAGLTFRPLDQTVQAALESPPPLALSDFTRERELELLSGLTGVGDDVQAGGSRVVEEVIHEDGP